MSTADEYDVIREEYDDLKSLKEGVPWETRWWEVKYKEVNVAVCLQILLSVGQSRESVHVWRQTEAGSFVLVWSFRTEGIGSLEVLIDDIKGIVSVKAIGRGNLENAVIAFMMLDAVIE